MGALRPDTVVLNWLLILPFCAALCAELFPRLNLGAHAEGEGEALKRGPFLLGALASLMGVALGVSLIPQRLADSPSLSTTGGPRTCTISGSRPTC